MADCVIVLGGDSPKSVLTQQAIKEAGLCLAADSGALYAIEAGRMPDVVLGDMDSLAPEVLAKCQKSGSEILRYPVAKDWPDGFLALKEAKKRGFESLDVVALFGNRIDFVLANILMLVPLALEGKKIRLLGEGWQAFYCINEFVICGDPGDVVSLLALTPKVGEVCLSGFEYSLEDYDLSMYEPRALSNVLREPQGFIRHSGGCLLVVHYPRVLVETKY